MFTMCDASAESSEIWVQYPKLEFIPSERDRNMRP